MPEKKNTSPEHVNFTAIVHLAGLKQNVKDAKSVIIRFNGYDFGYAIVFNKFTQSSLTRGNLVMSQSKNMSVLASHSPFNVHYTDITNEVECRTIKKGTRIDNLEIEITDSRRDSNFLSIARCDRESIFFAVLPG